MRPDPLRTYTAALNRMLEGTSDAAKRNVLLAACTFVVDRLIPGDPIAHSALAALKSSRYGDRQLVSQLGKHVIDLDELYFNAHDEFEAGRAPESKFRALFAQARAASAVECAFDPDINRAILTVVSETSAAVGLDVIKAEIDRAVGQRSARTE